MRKRIGALLAIMILFSGCGAPPKTAADYETIEDLKGARVGIVLARGVDWALEGEPELRNTMEIARYDEMSDILLALKFHKVNALLLDKPSAQLFMRLQGEEYEVKHDVLPPAQYGFMFTTRPVGVELLAEFNAFLAEFKLTEEYADIERRFNDIETQPYVHKSVENVVTNDRVIHAIFRDTSEPDSYINPTTGNLVGANMEVMIHFANSIGAKLEVSTGRHSACVTAVAIGTADIFAFGKALSGKSSMEMGGNVKLSDNVLYQGSSIITRKQVG